MKYRIFTVPVHAEGGEAELNAFISGHRVINVQREFVSNRENSFWSFCVEYVEGANLGGADRNLARDNRKDYKNELTPTQFAVFCRLRKRRKELSEAIGRPAYAVCTDNQLAVMAVKERLTIEDLKGIAGIGEAKIKQHGADLVRAHAGEPEAE